MAWLCLVLIPGVFGAGVLFGTAIGRYRETKRRL